MAEWGIRQGLAQNFGYDQRTVDLARQQNAMRQAQIYSENKAKMLADDFDYNNAMNAWDNTQVKQYAQGKLKELGQFIRSNPDFETNVEKRVAYKNLVKELKDNKALNEGLQVDSNIKAMQQYMNDPKNAPLVNSEDFQPVLQQYQNYIKTGSVDGNTANRKLFNFVPPEELVDTTPIYAKYAQMTAQNGKNTVHLGPGAASISQFVTDQDKGMAADGLINDRQFGRYVQKEYNEYLSKLPEGQKPMNIKQYAVSKMQPYFKGTEYKNYNYHVSDGGGSGKGKKGESNRDYLDELAKRTFTAKQTPGASTVVQASAAGVDELLTGGSGKLNTSGALFEIGGGKYIPFKSFLTKNYTTSNSEAKWDDTYGFMVSTEIQMPLDEAVDLFDSSDAFDDPWFSGPSVKSAFKDKISITKDEDGNDVAQIKVYKPIEYTNTSNRSAYAHGLHAKSEDINTSVNTNTGSRYLVSPDGTKYQDTETGIIYDSSTNTPINQ
jgi:hypothetical protein